MTIKLLGTASGRTHKNANQYVVSYDPDYHLPDGSYDGGALETSPDITKAKVFDGLVDAYNYWYQSPKCQCHSFRADGQPNRPLTAFHLVVE